MKQINKVAVLGAGVMGATIAAHLANAGIQVLLLDIVPRESNEEEKAAGHGITDARVRNRIAAAGLDGLKKMTPAPFFLPGYAAYIEVGNFEDDMAKLRDCDWVVEVVIENMGGAGGMTGSKRVATAQPDGYTMVLGSVGTHAQNQTLYKRPLYDVVSDFTPVAYLAQTPIAIITRPDLPVNNFKEFVAYAKANQNKMQFGSALIAFPPFLAWHPRPPCRGTPPPVWS